mmetsp:Transcript_10468/g.29866  ORF Transcript_10468/g.29866 Transcript_10468/m.29866 type:complete len:177 (-) Transcript_10468:201-731(-)|eukprot:CAMPEP_0170267598 /NCGR_PEP_ID=MMETSP0116_2-20130129/33725_1 /TAXON_ID=400756 /ORGANISM="Durinskia baltica, Strain CSIRO CS-38" /LENGTH=176 /DNA_ID=CAMNT_0010518753 /DNA_START=90 /DNA_END=620 /DNA_ORIENTATION=-
MKVRNLPPSATHLRQEDRALRRVAGHMHDAAASTVEAFEAPEPRPIRFPPTPTSPDPSRIPLPRWMRARARRPSPERRTTLIFQRISYQMTTDELSAWLDAAGFLGTYNAVHMPGKHDKQMNIGYAFVNFHTPQQAAACMSLFDGHTFNVIGPGQGCAVAYAREQGRISLPREAWR